MNIRKLLT